MSDLRGELVRWAERGALSFERMDEALHLTGAAPAREAWRDFLDRLLLWLGIVALAVALGFFIAANWQGLGRFGKIALCEAAVVLTLAVCFWRGLDSAWGRGALLGAALAVGTLLALVGQTYQTGADTYELFAVWALAIAAWVAVARLPALWVLWIGIVDLAAVLYLGLSPRWLGGLFQPHHALWAILGIHALALVVWEIGIAWGLRWLDVRWGPRLLAVVAGAAATALVVESIAFGRSDGTSRAPWAGYVAMLAGLYFAYRVRRIDVFILAAAVLSIIVVVTALTIRFGMLDGTVGFLGIGLVIIALAGAGATWLRDVARKATT